MKGGSQQTCESHQLEPGRAAGSPGCRGCRSAGGWVGHRQFLGEGRTAASGVPPGPKSSTAADHAAAGHCPHSLGCPGGHYFHPAGIRMAKGPSVWELLRNRGRVGENAEIVFPPMFNVRLPMASATFAAPWTSGRRPGRVCSCSSRQPSTFSAASLAQAWSTWLLACHCGSSCSSSPNALCKWHYQRISAGASTCRHTCQACRQT